MNPIAEEILSYFGISRISENELLHYGIKRRSGRYPYGSGDNPYQHGRDFLGRIAELKKSGFTFTDENGKTWTGDNAIAKSMGLTSTEYRRQVSWAGYEKRLQDVARIKSIQADGITSPTAIGKIMGINESSVRSLLNPKSEDKMHQIMETVNLLRDQVDEKGMIDVGVGVERELNISDTRLKNAIDYLQKAEGYELHGGRVPQPTNPGQYTTLTVLCKPGTPHKDIYNFENIKTIKDYISRDGGDTFEKKFYYPESLDSKRLKIRYDEEGGVDKDGIIELRRGVADLSLGESRYSQVRILVDGSHYLKGMAVYSDNMPDGVDVIFNTNKKQGTPMTDVLKKIKNDPENPFGSLIKDAEQGGQYWYDADTGKRVSANDPTVKNKKLGLINKRADEGDWGDWANAIPSQFLAKQTKAMAKKQLDLARADKMAEFDEYCSITNPTIKKHMLEKFADNCDSAAVHLKAAALPGQRYHVIIPVNTLKDNEVYAPNYENGTKLALIRYPHGGTFEIPILTVNNKHKPAVDLLGKDVGDAVGINKNIADRLSGADFDGDTVMCIPTHDRSGKVKIANKDELPGLKGFDNKASYGATESPREDSKGNLHYYRNGVEYKIMKDTQKQMGVISNLITDMTLGGANDDELARAVRHSMVVIDAEKHKLDYKASEIDNDIVGLKRKYQKKSDGGFGGAATLLSRAKGEETIEKRQGSYKVNIKGTPDYDPSRPEGAKLWKQADDLYYPIRKNNKAARTTTITTADGKKITYSWDDEAAVKKYTPVQKKDPKTGKVTFTNEDGDIEYKVDFKKDKSTRMAETDDAYTLVSTSKHPMELIYADYANDMKALGNKARLELKNTGKIAYSASAKSTYKQEVKDLEDKLNNALLNAPKERQVTRLATAEVNKKKAANPDAKKEDIKKWNQQAVTKYREEVGAVARRNRNIEITDREWDAIQAGAVTETTLKKILNNTDIDKLRERATPRSYTTLSTAQANRAKAMANSNYTLAEIADKLGVSTSTVTKYLKGGK